MAIEGLGTNVFKYESRTYIESDGEWKGTEVEDFFFAKNSEYSDYDFVQIVSNTANLNERYDQNRGADFPWYSSPESKEANKGYLKSSSYFYDLPSVLEGSQWSKKFSFNANLYLMGKGKTGGYKPLLKINYGFDVNKQGEVKTRDIQMSILK